VVVGASGAGLSVALALAGAASTAGGVVAALCLPGLGVAAAREAGVLLERLALVPDAGGRWAEVAAALLEGVDLLLAGPPQRVKVSEARRLSARARERGSVLVVVEMPGYSWPGECHLRLSVLAQCWEGLGWGHGYLRARQVEVLVGGRGAASVERRGLLRLP
jgi:hypothetical protein